MVENWNNKGGQVDKEKVQEAIKKYSAGNPELRTVLGIVCLSCKDIVDSMPNSWVDYLGRRSLLAASKLIHRRIGLNEILSQGDEYWETENGKRVDLALTNYLEKLKSRRQNN
ncbi:MAG TPA: hypothetical protein PK045_02305 [Candidatus Woesebacteria bacterium]|nr:hypothetical protein [Candidatus Woesebacteria bacterium]